jgi:hypothetical protein
MMPHCNGYDLASLAKHERMAARVRGKMPAVPSGALKRLMDVSITTWCGMEGKMVDEPYHSMLDGSVRAYLKD